jgi:hypothetical protein
LRYFRQSFSNRLHPLAGLQRTSAGVSAGFRQFPPVLDIAETPLLSATREVSAVSAVSAGRLWRAGCSTFALQKLWRLAALSARDFKLMGRSKDEGTADEESTTLSESQRKFSDTQKIYPATARCNTL